MTHSNLALPQTLYHGTDVEFDVFQPSPSGLFCSGIYLTTGELDAQQYGDVLMKVGVDMKRPFYTVADYDAGEAIDFDSPAVPFIREVFGRKAKAILKKAIHGDGNFGQEVQNALEAVGHDGVIVRWPDGLLHVIAFYPDQVWKI